MVAMLLGLNVGDLYERPIPGEAVLHSATIHRLTGVAAALAVVFVESVIVTYFIGTSRWCREVVDTYQLDPAKVAASNRLKRKTFPWALVGMLTVVGVAALGGASDPATGRPNTQAWSYWHLVGAFSGIALIAWTYFVAWNNVLANHAIVQSIVVEVARIRRERGLEGSQDGAAEPQAVILPASTAKRR